MRYRFGSVFYVIVLCLLAACGSGGDETGTATSAEARRALPAPSIEATLSKPKAFIGDEVTLSWSARNSNSCTILGIDSTVRSTAGAISLRPDSGGRFTYSIECRTPIGATARREVTLVVPMPVYSTSYENKNSIDFEATPVPTVRELGIPPVFPGEEYSRGAVAFADFFQEGQYSAFTTAFRATNTYASPGTADAPGVAYFLWRQPDGTWIDRTSELIPDRDERLNCVTNGLIIVADFNNDKKPDVYLACNGIDAELLPEAKERLTQQQQDEMGLSHQFVYLSTPEGTYRRGRLPDLVYGFNAAAADLNGDGNVDVLSSGDFQPFVYLGNGDGTFTRNDTILPANIHRYTDFTPNEIHHAPPYMGTLIPIDGRIDAVWGSSSRTIWMKGIRGGFDPTSTVVFQQAYSATRGAPYRMPLDIFFDNARRQFILATHAGVSVITPYDAEYAMLKYDTSGRYLGAFGVWLNPYNHTPTDPLEIRFQSFSDQYKALPNGDYKAHTAHCLIGLPGRCAQIIRYE